MKNIKTLKIGYAILCIFGLFIIIPAANAEVPAFDNDKPAATFTTSYSQVFNSPWDGTMFTNQWEELELNSFSAADIASGYLQFTWVAKRVLCSKATYSTPYVFSTVLDWSAAVTTNGGIVVRANPLGGNIDYLQVPGNDWGKMNMTGIAFYPTSDGQNLTVQFSATANGGGSTPQTRIDVPKPAGIASLLTDQGTLRIEDFGTTLYVYYRGAAYIRIDLGGLTGDVYTSGTVYNSNMESLGTFSGMEVVASGKVGVAQRVSNIRLYSAEILTTSTTTVTTSFDEDKPSATYPNTYNQVFTNWDGTAFFAKWDMVEASIPFVAADVTGGYLQFKWSEKRVIRSKESFFPPYIFQAELDWSAAVTTDGGMVIRAKPNSNPDVLQEPGDRVFGFNREGIAFYPSLGGENMIIQFSGEDVGYGTTAQTRINVPKPTSVASLKGRGVIRIEDFDTSIYVYYNDLPFARIDLGGKTGSIYTSGTVYDASMNILGTFTGMKVEGIGKLAIAQRNCNLRLYSVTQRYKGMIEQSITFNPIGIKQSNDAPFLLSASSTSGLPVELSIISGPATLSGNVVTLTGPGLVKVVATQPGGSGFFPAPEVTQYFFVKDPSASNETVQLKAYGDNWVATDAIGRTLPEYGDCGSYREKKYVGMFYLLWHADIPQGPSVKTFPQLMLDNPDSPAFEYGTNYYWGEPEDGFYHPSDPWSTRRNLQMLANAGVDFVYFDFTNGAFGEGSVESFMSVALDMYNKGIPVPKISIFLNWNYHASMPVILDKIYSHPEYDPILFKWEGKPLLLGDTTICATQWPQINDKGIKDYFTWRKMWAFDNSPWRFMDRYPQSYYSVGGVPEQMPVSKGFGAPLLNGDIGQGASFQKGKAPEYNQYWETDQTKYGYQFEEQWSRAHQVDPSIVCITGWNELMAGAWISSASFPVKFMGKEWDDPSWRCVNQATCPSKDANGNHIAHGWHVVDLFNKEFNRDICPMKDDITDNYYYQMVSHVRKYKGMSTPEPISESKTVSIDGNFDEWSNVTPIFKDAVGDVTNRNFKNVNGSAMLTNTTARNDISESRTTYDANNIYFYVKTVQNMTPSTDPNWMLLFIDADRNKGTGWEGYDYVVNLGVKSATETTLKKWDGKNWGNELTVPYKLTANAMELSIPRTAVLMHQSTPEFYFKWSDNAQQLDSINCFFTDGESAPDRRFNYNYSTTKVAVNERTAYKTHNIPGTIEFEDFDNGGAGVAYADATLGNTSGAYRPNESVDIEPKTGGGYNIGFVNTNEWLKYTVTVNAIGKFTASIHYAANGEGNQAVLYVNDTDKSGIISFPSTGNSDTWSNKTVDLHLTAGKHTLKFFVKNATSDFKLDNIVFTEKEVVYPGNGTGLTKTLWTAVAPRTWFKDSICTEVGTTIDEEWADVSPGCGIAKDFWNVRWTGQIQSLFTEVYTFYLTVNDMGRVWINNQLLIDAWLATSSGKTFTGTIALTAGQKVPIKVDFAEMGGDAKVKLEWSSASNPREVVPQSQLYPMGTTGVSDIRQAYFNIYPNPAINHLTISSGVNQVGSIQIIDLQGRVVYSDKQPFAGQKSIDISLEKGIYFVKLSGDITFATQKLIIE